MTSGQWIPAFQAEGTGPPAAVRVRRLLKAAPRGYRLRCARYGDEPTPMTSQEERPGIDPPDEASEGAQRVSGAAIAPSDTFSVAFSASEMRHGPSPRHHPF